MDAKVLILEDVPQDASAALLVRPNNRALGANLG